MLLLLRQLVVGCPGNWYGFVLCCISVSTRGNNKCQKSCQNAEAGVELSLPKRTAKLSTRMKAFVSYCSKTFCEQFYKISYINEYYTTLLNSIFITEFMVYIFSSNTNIESILFPLQTVEYQSSSNWTLIYVLFSRLYSIESHPD